MEKNNKKLSNKTWLKPLCYALAIILCYIIISILIENRTFGRKYTSLFIPIGINIMLAVSLNITTGFLGELSLGHAAFLAVGAYSGALVTTNLVSVPEIPAMILALLTGGVLAAVAGILIGIPVLRLRGDYLAIATLAFGEIVRSIINTLKITGGPKGISSIPAYSNYTLVYVFVIITILFAMNLKKSRFGRAIFAIRDNDIAAEAMGIPLTKYKILAFTISAFFAGIAGVLYAHDRSIIKPDQFDYNKSIDILVYVVLGGMGSIKGSVIAAIILTVLPQALSEFGEWRMLSYALALIIIMIFNAGDIREKLGKFSTALREKKGEN
ncbi:MAG: branched-chain amino acid ABC transporter permease [Clostridiales bacterium]|nr:branched-chain amino acid ABC transporter permease [Clostridiales bacterium]